MSWITDLPWDLIDQAAKRHNLEPSLIGAIIQKESAGDPWALRYEPNWKYDFNSPLMARSQRTTLATQVQIQKFSFGLMQVMGTVAYELGLRESPMKLCAYPQLGIMFGCLKLAQLSNRYSDIEDIVSSYNAGSVIMDRQGKRINQMSYVIPVLDMRNQIKLAGR